MTSQVRYEQTSNHIVITPKKITVGQKEIYLHSPCTQDQHINVGAQRERHGALQNNINKTTLDTYQIESSKKDRRTTNE
jgi:hypothetical protein